MGREDAVLIFALDFLKLWAPKVCLEAIVTIYKPPTTGLTVLF